MTSKRRTARSPNRRNEPAPAADDTATVAGNRPQRVSVAELSAHTDYANWSGVSGWIWDPQEPERRIELALFDGDFLLATTIADEYRPDLEQAGIGDGRHCFSISLTGVPLPNARHVLHLRPVGSELELPHFPLALTRDDVGFDASARGFLIDNVAAELSRAQRAEQLSPLVNDLVDLLDRTLARCYELDTAVGSAPTTLEQLQEFRRRHPVVNIDYDEEPVVSIVIPACNEFAAAYRCVELIARSAGKTPFEIVIVDDGSRDATLFARFAFGRGIKLVRRPNSGGFIRACNRGCDAAAGAYLVFLHSDVEVREDWLDELYDTLQRDREIGIAGAKLLAADGTVEECGSAIGRHGRRLRWGFGRRSDEPNCSYLRDVDCVSSTGLMIEKPLFIRLGKFDEEFSPRYYEDADLCLRAQQAGYRTVIQPAAQIVRLGANLAEPAGVAGDERRHVVNQRKFLERWTEVLAVHADDGERPRRLPCAGQALVIDDWLPTPAQDAGSNAVFQHMLSLQRLGFAVTFIPGDMARSEPAARHLQRLGVRCLYRPYYRSVEDAVSQPDMSADVVYLHRYSNAAKYAGMTRQLFPEARLVYSVADLHFLRLARQADIEDDPRLRREADHLRRLELGAMRFVDRVIVHSVTEAELLRQISADLDVRVIPWTVEPREVRPVAAPGRRIAFIGNYYHLPNVDAAKWAAAAVMPELRKAVAGITLLLVGSHMPEAVSALAADDILPLGYVASLDEIYAQVRLTVAPLRYGAGLKGKVLESLAAGIPCVMTEMAAEGLCLPAELAPLVAAEPRQLAQCVGRLFDDDAEYCRLAECGKAYVRANYAPERIDALLRAAVLG